ncbi:MAG: OadG family protein [Desulfuromusa sp.]|jgi:sodium pump decarboxylase gamma subunit|nr:OadG family protein [Desulfuromusa sp.]
MTVTELLALFANPDVMQTLSTPDKLLAGLITTILGMGITFTALIILQFIISWMDKLLNNSKAPQPKVPVTAPAESPLTKAKTEPQQDDNELVAVIASVIAMKMKTSVENIVIKNIEKIDDQSPAWNRAGIIEQMNSRL